MIEQELVKKHIRRLVEVTTNVRAQTRTSSKGKKFNVKAHDREIGQLKAAIRDAEDALIVAKGEYRATKSKKDKVHVSAAERRVEGAYRKLQVAIERKKLAKSDIKAKNERAIKRDEAAERTRNRFRKGPATDAGEWS